jgi:hypothetical protein
MALNQVMKIGGQGGSSGKLTIAPDVYLARIQHIVHIGLEKNTFPGAKQLFTDKIAVVFQISDVRTSDNRPATLTKTGASSLGEKSTLTKIVQAATGKTSGNIDLKDLLGAPVQVQVELTPTGSPKIANILKVSSSQLKLVSPIEGETILVLNKDDATDAQKKALPKWLADKLSETVDKTAHVEIKDLPDTDY